MYVYLTICKDCHTLNREAEIVRLDLLPDEIIK